MAGKTNGGRGKRHARPKGKDGHLCCTKYCRNPRKKNSRSRLCSACIQSAWRRRHPLRAYWRSIKDRARRKHREFDIPFPLFEAMAVAAGVHESGHGLHFDRKDATKGYTPDNVQFLTAHDNIAKGNRERHLPEYVKAILAAKKLKTEDFVCDVETLGRSDVETNESDGDPF